MNSQLPRWESSVKSFMNAGQWEIESEEERELTRLSLWLEHTTWECECCGYCNGIWEWRDIYLEHNDNHRLILVRDIDEAELMFVFCDSCDEKHLIPLLEFCPRAIKASTAFPEKFNEVEANE